jgi:hypothetical protein
MGQERVTQTWGIPSESFHCSSLEASLAVTLGDHMWHVAMPPVGPSNNQVVFAFTGPGTQHRHQCLQPPQQLASVRPQPLAETSKGEKEG